MARLILTSVGTLGDLYPFLALGQMLRGRGHEILFAVERPFAERVQAVGFTPTVLSGDIVAAFHDYAPVQRLSLDPAASIQHLLTHYLLPTLPTVIDELRKLGVGADALITSNVQLAGPIAADVLGLPWLSVTLTPASVPSRYLAPYPYRWPTRGALYERINQVGWSIGRRLLRRYSDPFINRIRTAWGLPPTRDVMFTGGLSHHFTAVAISPAIIPAVDDWPDSVQPTGFCFWEESDWQEPPELTAWLADPRPIVAVSLGSIAPTMGVLYAPLYAAATQAIVEVGARALIIGAPQEVEGAESADVLSLPYAPHARVFPRCAVVIQHGGIGTAAQVWRAGIPSLVLPGGVDQFVTAALVAQLQGGQWLRRERATPKRLAAHLQALLQDRPLQQRARALGEQIRTEQGVTTLATAIEAQLGATQ